MNSLVARLHIFKDELPVYVLAEKIRYPCGKLLRKDRTILLYSSLPALTVGKIKDELAGMSDGFDTVRYYVSPSISMGIDRAIGDGNQILIYCKTGMESSHKESSSLSQPVEQDANPASKESPSPSQVDASQEIADPYADSNQDDNLILDAGGILMFCRGAE